MRKLFIMASLALFVASISLAAEKTGTLGVSLMGMSNPFYKAIADGMELEARKHGIEVVVVDANYDVSRQANQVKDFIANGYNGIVLSPCDSKAIGPVIKEANDAGIPVFTVDIASLADTGKVVSHIATDNSLGGAIAADAMVKALNGKGKVGFISHNEVETGLMRMTGFRDQLKKLGVDKDMPIVVDLDSKGSRARGYNATQDAIQAHPDLAGLFFVGDEAALGGVAALEAVGKLDQVILIGFDGMDEAKQAIKDGKLYADPVQFPDRLGMRTVETFAAYMEGEKVEPVQLVAPEIYTRADALKDPSLK